MQSTKLSEGSILLKEIHKVILNSWFFRFSYSDELKPLNLFLETLFTKSFDYHLFTVSLQWYLHYLKHDIRFPLPDLFMNSFNARIFSFLFKIFLLPIVLLLFAFRFFLMVSTSFSIQPSGRVSEAPGAIAQRLLRFIVPKVAFDQIFSQAISDMREEYFEALQENELLKAKWIIFRDHLGLALTFASYLGTSVGKRVVELWKIGS
jgi:hypothetical protein